MKDIKITPRITVRDTRTITSYLQEVSRYPVLSPEEEYKVAARAKAGDPEAQEKLIKSNLRFVISVSNQFVGNGLDQMDLIEEGNIGLMRAVQMYDCDRGFRFCSYAVSWILQSILAAIEAKGRMVYIPLNKSRDQLRVKNFITKYEMVHCETPSSDIIAEKFGFRPEYVDRLLSVSGKHYSIDAPLKEGEESTYLDVMVGGNSTDNDIDNGSLKDEIQHVLSVLCERDRKIVELSFGLNGMTSQTLEEISRQVGLSTERVRQLRKQAIDILARSPQAQLLRDYLCA